MWKMGCIILLGLFIKVLYWRYNVLIPSRDAVGYVNIISEWFQTGSFDSAAMRLANQSSAVPPFLIFAGKLLMHCGLSPYASGLLVNMLLGTFFPLVIFGCARRLWPEFPSGAFVAAGLAAIQPSLVDFSTDVTREMSYLFFAGLAFYFWLGMYQRKSRPQAICCGGMIALATLCRYEAFEIYLLFILTMVIGSAMRHFKWRQAAVMTLLNWGGALLGYLVFFLLAGIKPAFVWLWAGKIFRYLGAM